MAPAEGPRRLGRFGIGSMAVDADDCAGRSVVAGRAVGWRTAGVVDGAAVAAGGSATAG